MPTKTLYTYKEGFALCNKILADIDKDYTVKVTYHSMDKRTAAQNAYYWTGVVKPAYEFYKLNPVAFFRDVVKLTKADITKEFVHQLFKFAFLRGRSTTDLGKPEFFDELITPAREHFFHEHGELFDEPPPNELTHKGEYENY